jgi:hypothetical protein
MTPPERTRGDASEIHVRHDEGCAHWGKPCDCSATAHIREQPRTHGYVIRWPAGKLGPFKYAGNYATDKSLKKAFVYTLPQASQQLRAGFADHAAEIVRVRRVEGEDRWAIMSFERARNIRLQTAVVGADIAFNTASAVYQIVERISTAPRWEIDEEEP